MGPSTPGSTRFIVTKAHEWIFIASLVVKCGDIDTPKSRLADCWRLPRPSGCIHVHSGADAR
jgi:hypothetical protein